MFKIEDGDFSEEIREKLKKTRTDDIILLVGALLMVGASYIGFIKDNQIATAIVVGLGVMVVVYARWRYKKHWKCDGCQSKLPWFAYMRHMTNCINCGRTYITDEKRKTLIEQGEIEK